jgi:UDP-N-acetylmuramoylalanine--D-glutamate ligase
MSCARYLHQRGERFCVVDTRSEPPALAQLRSELPGTDIYLQRVPTGLLESAEEVIVSPGIALDAPVLAPVHQAGVAVVGDIDLFVRAAEAPVIGITGSNAKSTVTELVGRMAARSGLTVGVGGNLGTPALDLLAADTQLYVLELSSFQLERAGELGLAVAAVLNISADHLDRHGDMQGYHRAKHRIFRGCRGAVINCDDALTRPLVDARVKVTSWRVGEPELSGFGLRNIDGQPCLCHGFEALLPASELAMAGRHNIGNALAALAIAEAGGVDSAAAVATLREFRGLPHRCEEVAAIAGVRFINDSKGTNIGATAAALEGFGGDRNIVLIAGGQGKGADFSALRAVVERHCKLLLLIGEAASEMQSCLGDLVPTRLEETLEQAVREAGRQALPGDCVLLSPACASFDMFSGYVERGERFREVVAFLSGETP